MYFLIGVMGGAVSALVFNQDGTHGVDMPQYMNHYDPEQFLPSGSAMVAMDCA